MNTLEKIGELQVARVILWREWHVAFDNRGPNNWKKKNGIKVREHPEILTDVIAIEKELEEKIELYIQQAASLETGS